MHDKNTQQHLRALRRARLGRKIPQGAEAGEEETRHAVLEYVVKGLHEALVTVLLEGFH
jgi:hypothetical protein